MEDTKMKIYFNQPIKVEMIFSFDNNEQQMWRTEVSKISVDAPEHELIRDLIKSAFEDDLALTKDLYKISMAVSCKSRDFTKIPCMKKLLNRNGKYYFQPDQRDEVESKIIEGSIIASQTRPFAENKFN
jgi:hypothetical protein